MSLASAVLDIADEMEKHQHSEVKGFAFMLRLAVKAAGGETPKESLDTPEFLDIQRKVAERKQRQINEHIAQQERGGTRMVELVEKEGEAGPLVEIPPTMPEGAFLPIGNNVFQLKGSKLHFDAAQTERYVEAHTSK